jgi:uncharacterized protein
MKSKLLQDAVPRTYLLVLDTGEEVTDGLHRFARENRVRAGHFSGIGGFQDVTLGFFDFHQRQYVPNPIDQWTEVVSLLGNIAEYENDVRIHAHAVVGKRDGSAWAGHLLEAHVRPTLEVILVESSVRLRRRFDDETGLTLLAVDEPA